MIRTCFAVLAIIAITAPPSFAQDARAVIAAASKVMGVDNLNAVTVTGAGANYLLGQSTSANGPWNRTNISDYTRTIDFTQPALRASAVTYAIPLGGTAAVQGMFNQVVTPMNAAWAQQLNIWVTPWGFLKGAAANNATVRTQTIDGKRYNVVTWSPAAPRSPSGQPYRVVGYINDENLVEKVETWVEHIMFGDMLVETLYSDYRDAAGFKYPITTVQRQGGGPAFELQTFWAVANPPNLAQLMQPPAGRGGGPGGAPGGPGGPGGPAGPPAAPMASAEKLADGVYKITGGYTALAIEFADHVVVVEAGQSDQRAQAVLEQARRAIPNKPVRYVVNTHHHFDHSSGLPYIVAEGITIVTHETNRALLERALSAPRTLGNDALAQKGRGVRPRFETVTGARKVMQDATRTLELHWIQGLQHADGMLIAYLPREGIVLQGDLYAAPNPNAPAPAANQPPNAVTVTFVDNVRRLGLNVNQVVSVHAPNPDRQIPWQEIQASVQR
jgi:glyoxylase-like metal-dependent hydrolase (beta-lactamase superfamily II)